MMLLAIRRNVHIQFAQQLGMEWTLEPILAHLNRFKDRVDQEMLVVAAMKSVLRLPGTIV